MPVLQRVAEQRQSTFRQISQQLQLLFRAFQLNNPFLRVAGDLQQLIIDTKLRTQS